MNTWKVTGTKQGKLVTIMIDAADHNAAVTKASKGKHLLVVHDCVLIEQTDRAMEWIAEADYVARVATVRGNVTEMNHDWATFVRYCQMRSANAREEGFNNIADEIDACVEFTCKQCGQHITDGKACGCGARY